MSETAEGSCALGFPCLLCGGCAIHCTCGQEEESAQRARPRRPAPCQRKRRAGRRIEKPERPGG